MNTTPRPPASSSSSSRAATSIPELTFLVLHPLTTLATASALYTLVGWQTLNYTPEWLAYPVIWAAVAFTAGLSCLVALVYPARLVVVTAGATAVVAASSRAFAITRELVTAPRPPASAFASFLIAAATWSALALLWWQLFAGVVVPWAAARRHANE